MAPVSTQLETSLTVIDPGGYPQTLHHRETTFTGCKRGCYDAKSMKGLAKAPFFTENLRPGLYCCD